MKSVILLFVSLASSTAALAQTAPVTQVKVRDNGTEKVVTKTGKTNVGQALDNTVDAAGNVAGKAGAALRRGAQKTGRAAKRTGQKASRATERGTGKLEEKSK